MNAAPSLFPPLFQALAANLPPSDLRAFLRYALAEIGAPGGEQAAPEAPLTTSLDCRANKLTQVHATKAELDLVLPAAGFQYSGRRQSYFHACTVSSRRQPGDKRRGGKLERFHNVVGVADYNPQTYNPAPFRKGRQRKAVAR